MKTHLMVERHEIGYEISRETLTENMNQLAREQICFSIMSFIQVVVLVALILSVQFHFY